ncbi:hypothetical protein PENANT_c005G06607 [Penicillium antarcticum]|uniref:Uncharacterized protein n=1 Tax=Penicillium antarcticum TaxID=416450 RepID=A0A1V6QFP1_9EURO|nr:hypothetical protein PENANT_c005G06607 [Penicillium antarcticum]
MSSFGWSLVSFGHLKSWGLILRNGYVQLLVAGFGVIASEAVAARCLASTSTLLQKPGQPLLLKYTNTPPSNSSLGKLTFASWKV